MRWSTPIKLSYYTSAPDEKGIYEIGFGDKEFEANYLGRDKRQYTSIRTRLSAHYNLRANKKVTERNRDSLHVRWSKVSDPACTEAILLKQKEYPWNEKIENYDWD
jgi:hypothetical protein